MNVERAYVEVGRGYWRSQSAKAEGVELDAAAREGKAGVDRRDDDLDVLEEPLEVADEEVER